MSIHQSKKIFFYVLYLGILGIKHKMMKISNNYWILEMMFSMGCIHGQVGVNVGLVLSPLYIT